MLFAISAPNIKAQSAPSESPRTDASRAGTADTSGSRRYRFDISNRSLSEALREFGQICGQEIIFDEELVAGLHAPAVKGDLTAAEALKQLLKGTDLVAVRSPSGSLILKRQTATASSGSNPLLDEVIVTGILEGLAATRSATPLKEIPQSVSVISQETLKQQNATDLASALAQAPGITLVQSASQLTLFYSRGYQIDSIHIDGSAPLSVSQGGSIDATSRDLSQYESIEILRGSDALFGGNGEPGGTLNLTRKQPTANFQADFEASAGSWDLYRLVGDVSGPLTSDHRLSGRMVVGATTQQYFYDVANLRKGSIYAVLKYDLAPSTSIEVGGSFERSHGVVNADGLPLYDTGADPHLPRSLALTVPWARSDNLLTEGFAKLDHHFNDNWRLRVNGTYLVQDTPEYTATSYSGPIDSTTGLLGAPLSATIGPGRTKQTLLDGTLTGAFEVRGLKQEVMLGADFQRDYNPLDNQLYSNPIGPVINPFAFDPAQYPAPDLSPANLMAVIGVSQASTQWGIYGSVRIRPIKDLALIGGFRDSALREHIYLTETASGQQFPPVIQDFSSSGKLTPYGGITYDLGTHYSVYASYADIFHTNAGTLDKNLRQLPDTDGVNLEVGVKGAWFANALNGSLAAFKIDQTGVPTFDSSVPQLAFNCCYLPGSTHSKGFETELSGAVTSHWQMTLGYTYDMHRIVFPDRYLELPRHLFKAWTNYELPFAGYRWSIGGGERLQSINRGAECVGYNIDFTCNQFVKFSQGFFAVTDVRTAFAFNKHWSAALSINNLFDRTYYQTIMSRSYGNWYGAPRNFLFKIEGKL